MILYGLTCANDHHFEGWFRDSTAFDRQQELNHISCPVCEDCRIAKAPMAPRIGRNLETLPDEAQPMPELPTGTTHGSGKVTKMVADFCRDIETCCDYVGPKFPEEARKIHYGEANARGIYGEATREEAVALKEEGIEIASIPWMKKADA